MQCTDMAAIHDAARVCGVPADLRATVWPWLLGVQQSNDTDPTASWKGKLDLPNQSALRADCQALLKSLKRRGLLESIEVEAGTMESLLTMYCKRRAVPYQFVLAKVRVAVRWCVCFPAHWHAPLPRSWSRFAWRARPLHARSTASTPSARSTCHRCSRTPPAAAATAAVAATSATSSCSSTLRSRPT